VVQQLVLLPPDEFDVVAQQAVLLPAASAAKEELRPSSSPPHLAAPQRRRTWLEEAVPSRLMDMVKARAGNRGGGEGWWRQRDLGRTTGLGMGEGGRILGRMEHAMRLGAGG
jgi:hypothetical protein